MRTVVKTFLSLQRFEVFLAILLPFFLIVESAIANGSVYAGGHLDLGDARGWVALGRGLFFEVLTYAAAKLAKILWTRGKSKAGAVLVGGVALWCIVVSAGNNLGWVLNGGELNGVFASMAHVLPPVVMGVYQAGLGLLLPLAVGALALVDVSHLVHEAMESSEMDNQAVQVSESEMHRTQFLKSQNKQRKKIREAYDGIAAERADTYISRVKGGDLTFGTQQAPSIGVRRLTPLPSSGSAPRLLSAPKQVAGNRL